MVHPFLVILLSGLLAQSIAPEKPRPLTASSSHLLQVPPFSATGVIQCDRDFNTYYHVFNGSYRQASILSFSLSGEKSTLYKLPDDIVDEMSFIDFSVSPDGVLKVLAGDKDYHPIVFGFSGDGRMISQAKLDVPAKIVGEHFSVFLNGTILFYGYYGREAAKDLAGKRYLALFKPSGTLIKQIDKAGLGEMNPGEQATHLPEGGAAIGADGNVYVLSSDKVLVVSPSGQIQRRIPFTKPGPEFSSLSVQYSEGLLAISFAKAEGKKLEFRYLVINASDGEKFGLYEPSEETGNNNVCFSRHDGFLFSTVKNDRINFVTAPLR